MNQNPFETIQYWLSKNQLTAQEKRRVKQAMVSYMTTHPVKSGLLSPYTFRYATMALASLVIVLGGSIGITHAAMSALPNQKLYPIKMWIEQVKSDNQKTPSDKIAFETARIETRFNEATQLAIKHQLDATSSEIIESGITNSQNTINTVANSVSGTNPELALAATNNLETTFSSNSKILATIGKNTNQDLGIIILGAQITTQKLATEQVKFEQIVAMKPNDASKTAALAALATLETKFKAPQSADQSSTATQTTTTDLPAITVPDTATSITASTVVAPLAIDTTATSVDSPLVIASATTATPVTASVTIAPPSTTTTSAQTLVTQAKKQMAAGSYSDAVVTLQKAQQILDEATLTQSLENTYQVQVTPTASSASSGSTTATPDTTEATASTSTSVVPAQVIDTQVIKIKTK